MLLAEAAEVELELDIPQEQVGPGAAVLDAILRAVLQATAGLTVEVEAAVAGRLARGRRGLARRVWS